MENLDVIKSLVSERLSHGLDGKANGTNNKMNGSNEIGADATPLTTDGVGQAPIPPARSKNQSKSPDSDDIRVMQMVLASEVSNTIVQ